MLYQSSLLTAGLGSTPLMVKTVYSVAKSSPTVLGATIFASLAATAVFTPVFSSVVDRVNSRGKVVAAVTLAEPGVYLFASLIYYVLGDHIASFSAIILGGEVLANLYWVAANTLLRDVVTKENYRAQAGYAEALGQAPAILGAGSAIVLSTLPFPVLVALACAMDGLSALLASKVPGTNPEPRRVGDDQPRASAGFYAFIRGNLPLVLLMYLMGFPFVFTVVGNLLKPVFIASVLGGGPPLLAFSEAEYASFAVLAGLATPRLQNRLGDQATLLAMFASYSAGSLIMPAYPFIPLYAACQAVHGLGNPGSRVVRKSVMLKAVGRGELGRLNGSVSLMYTLTRLSLIGWSTLAMAQGVEVTRVMELLALLQFGLTGTYLLFARTRYVKSVFSKQFG